MIDVTPAPTGEFTKRSLLVLSHALERTFDHPHDAKAAPGLVIGMFQRREYFDIEQARYTELAAKGHVTLVAFAGSIENLPEDVHAVQLSPQEPGADDWVLSLVRGAFAGSLVARDVHALGTGEITLEASRLFQARWGLRRHLALTDALCFLSDYGHRLPVAAVAAARAQVELSAAVPVCAGEMSLADAAEHLVAAVDAGQRRSNRLRVDLAASQDQAEHDQLTGLHNRHFLERYLGAAGRPADLMALLIDVDDLKAVNEAYGHAAGDALLSEVASVLREQTRSGEVLVRWGGDEFLILVPGVGPQVALRFGERLVDAVQSSRLAAPWQGVSPSVSIGVCAARKTPLPLGQLSEALRGVKHAGKGAAALAPEAVRT